MMQLHNGFFPGLVFVPCSRKIQPIVGDAFAAWQVWCKQVPSDEKKLLALENDAGYEYRDGADGLQDPKETCHVTLASVPRLLSVSHRIGNDHMTACIEQTAELLEALVPIVRDYTLAIEEAHALPGLTNSLLAHKDQWIIRFLRYFGARFPGAQIGNVHPDKGFCTVALREDVPGLQFETLARPRVWKDIAPTNEQLVMFPGLQAQYITQGKIKGMRHRIIVPEDEQAAACVERHSMVGFFEATGEGVRRYRSEVYGSTHTLLNNYNISSTQLAQKFQ